MNLLTVINVISRAGGAFFLVSFVMDMKFKHKRMI